MTHSGDRADPVAVPIGMVLDTNVVLDWLHFHDRACAALDEAVARRRVQLLSADDCLQELESVLARPQFGLTGPARERLIFEYCRHVKRLEPCPSPCTRLPACRDPDDQKFLELAARGRAGVLLSRDKALLALARSLERSNAGFVVMDPARFGNWLRYRQGAG